MNIELNKLYLELLKYPNSPKPYRDLALCYAKENKMFESSVFSTLLIERFKEVPDLYDNNTNINQKQ